MSANIQAVHTQAQALLRAGAAEQAEALLRPYLANGRGPIPLWRNMAVALQAQGRFEEVRRIRLMLVEHLPGDLAARYDLAETLLLLGDFERGWREYRFRYSLAHTKRIERKMQRPRWSGEAIPGRTLLIHDEQGYGDTFQFIRLVRLARARSAARIILEVNREIPAADPSCLSRH